MRSPWRANVSRAARRPSRAHRPSRATRARRGHGRRQKGGGRGADQGAPPRRREALGAVYEFLTSCVVGRHKLAPPGIWSPSHVGICMPRMTVCSASGCPELIPVGSSRCADHARPAWQTPSRHTRDRPSDWWKRKQRVKRRDGGRCVRCGGTGTHVDHIVRVADGGSWEIDNLQTLCPACHAVKTRMERRAR
jgi:5-methylcytosine-specific restriction enzyme A